MDCPRRDRGERFEHEKPLVQAGVGDPQARLVMHLVAEEQQVEINQARPPAHSPLAPEGRLDG